SANSATPTNSLIRRDNFDSAIQSNLHQHGQHERPSARALFEKTPELDTQLLRHQSLIGALFHARYLNALGNDTASVLEERRSLALGDDKAARHDLGLADECSRLASDRDDGYDDAVARQMAA